jgi:hypothetical protein
VATRFGGKRGRGLTTGIPERSPASLHYAVVRHDKKGLEMLRIRLEGKGEVLPVFSAAWAARGYLFAEAPGGAPGGGWYVSTYTPGELISVLVGPCAGVEWVALDPRADSRSGGEVANLMSRENFVDYLLRLTRPFSYFDGTIAGLPRVEAHGRRGNH